MKNNTPTLFPEFEPIQLLILATEGEGVRLYGIPDGTAFRGMRQPDPMPSSDDNPLIPTHGGYRKLLSFQIAQLVYDVTVRFCDKYVNHRSRTHDQMVQAARSGVQNIAEGSLASGTSKKIELKLTNIARASLEELRLDYEDFLRHRRLPPWSRNDPRGRELVARRLTTADMVAAWVLDVAALVLITVACSLLERQIEAQATAFERDGGFTERLYKRRSERRKR